MRGILGLDDEFKFGKHQGQQVEDVVEDDPDYIYWIVQNEICEFDDETLELIERKGIA